MTETEKASILEWMDKQIELHEALSDTQTYNEKISRCSSRARGEIHIFEGIKELAEAAGKEIAKREEDVFRNQWELCYKGYTFFSLKLR